MAHHQQLLDWIENELINQNLHLGDELPNDRVLAREVGISQNLMRESLKHCEEIGVLRLYEGRKKSIIGVLLHEPASSAAPAIGLYMASSRAPHQDLLNTCLVLESYALAGPSYDKSALPKLEQIVEAMQDAGTSLTDFHDLEADFHIQLSRLSGNVLVSALLATLRDVMVEARFELVDRVPLWSDTSARLRMEYRAIVDAVRSGDYALAQTLLRANLRERFAEAGHQISLSEDLGQSDEGLQFTLEPVDIDAHGLVPDEWGGTIEPELFQALSTIQPIKPPAPSKNAESSDSGWKASVRGSLGVTGDKAKKSGNGAVATGDEAGLSEPPKHVQEAGLTENTGSDVVQEHSKQPLSEPVVPSEPEETLVEVAKPTTTQKQPSAPSESAVLAEEEAVENTGPGIVQEHSKQPLSEPVVPSEPEETLVEVAKPTTTQKQPSTPPESDISATKEIKPTDGVQRKRRETVSPVIRATVIPPRQAATRPAQGQHVASARQTNGDRQPATSHSNASQILPGPVEDLEEKIRREEARLSALDATGHAQDGSQTVSYTKNIGHEQEFVPLADGHPAKATSKKMLDVANYFGFKQAKAQEQDLPPERHSFDSAEGRPVTANGPSAERSDDKLSAGYEYVESSADKGNGAHPSGRRGYKVPMDTVPWSGETSSAPHRPESATPSESAEELAQLDALESTDNFLGQQKGKKKSEKDHR